MADYNQAFDFIQECCGEPEYTDYMNLSADYWETVLECMDPIWDKAFAATIYGKPDKQLWYNKMNTFVYLFGIFTFLFDDLQRSANESPCGVPDYETILANYNLSCYYDVIKCMGCRPDFAKRVFELFNINITDFTALNDGIDFMYIEGGGVDCPGGPIFRVF